MDHQVIKEWNPAWKPQLWMTDYSEAELLAIQQVFPEANIFLCDFHRERCWQQWVRDKNHGLNSEDGALLLSQLRKMAYAENVANYNDAEEQLRQSELWTTRPHVRAWLEGKWLSIPEVSFALCLLKIS